MNRQPNMRMAAASAALAVALCVTGTAMAKPAAAETRTARNCSAAQIARNEALAVLFDRSKDPMAAYAKMTPDYIQHNPIARRIGMVNGVSGRDEFKLLLELMASGVEGPPPPIPGQPPETFDQVMADCDHVFLLKKSWMPDPQAPGTFYPVFDFDFWRIENGKLAEHWDGARIPPRLPRAMTVPKEQLYAEAKAQPAVPKP